MVENTSLQGRTTRGEKGKHHFLLLGYYRRHYSLLGCSGYDHVFFHGDGMDDDGLDQVSCDGILFPYVSKSWGMCNAKHIFITLEGYAYNIQEKMCVHSMDFILHYITLLTPLESSFLLALFST